MRLWHWEILEFLPNKQILGQWKEVGMVIGAIKKNGTPNHLLVNKVMDYPSTELLDYMHLVYDEMKYRGFNVSEGVLNRRSEQLEKMAWDGKLKANEGRYNGWHDRMYLDICYFNLLEKHQCGGISQNEWDRFENGFNSIM